MKNEKLVFSYVEKPKQNYNQILMKENVRI